MPEYRLRSRTCFTFWLCACHEPRMQRTVAAICESEDVAVLDGLIGKAAGLLQHAVVLVEPLLARRLRAGAGLQISIHAATRWASTQHSSDNWMATCIGTGLQAASDEHAHRLLTCVCAPTEQG